MLLLLWLLYLLCMYHFLYRSVYILLCLLAFYACTFHWTRPLFKLAGCTWTLIAQNYYFIRNFCITQELFCLASGILLSTYKSFIYIIKVTFHKSYSLLQYLHMYKLVHEMQCLEIELFCSMLGFQSFTENLYVYLGTLDNENER